MSEGALVKIDAKEYGLEEVKAKEIESVFVPMINKMKELEDEYNEVIKKDICKELCSEAKALRLKYVKVRTGTALIHKEAKAFYLAGGRFVDGWKNAQLYASSGMENRLKQIEDHYVNIEKERIAKLQDERTVALSKFEVETEGMDLGSMKDDVWDNFLLGHKASYTARIDAEKKAEADRIQKEKEEAEAREKQRLENEKLKAEAEKREAEIKKEREAVEAERKAEAEKREAVEKQAKIAQEKAKKAEAEKKRMEAELAKMIVCPKCNHKFNPEK